MNDFSGHLENAISFRVRGHFHIIFQYSDGSEESINKYSKTKFKEIIEQSKSYGFIQDPFEIGTLFRKLSPVEIMKTRINPIPERVIVQIDPALPVLFLEGEFHQVITVAFKYKDREMDVFHFYKIENLELAFKYLEEIGVIIEHE